jgi:hypothetical protein
MQINKYVIIALSPALALMLNHNIFMGSTIIGIQATISHLLVVTSNDHGFSRMLLLLTMTQPIIIAETTNMMFHTYMVGVPTYRFGLVICLQYAWQKKRLQSHVPTPQLLRYILKFSDGVPEDSDLLMIYLYQPKLWIKCRKKIEHLAGNVEQMAWGD